MQCIQLCRSEYRLLLLLPLSMRLSCPQCCQMGIAAPVPSQGGVTWLLGLGGCAASSEGWAGLQQEIPAQYKPQRVTVTDMIAAQLPFSWGF